MKFISYDIEVFRNLFLCGFKTRKGRYYFFEVSHRKNQLHDLKLFIDKLKVNSYHMVGFNNNYYDYPVVHHALQLKSSDVSLLLAEIYKKSKSIIETQWNNRFNHLVRSANQLVPQIDLLQIHHFDNINKATSLKALEFAMQMDSIQDLPYQPDAKLTSSQIDDIIDYNKHDLDATDEFLSKSITMIEFRDRLSAKYNVNMLNFNDPKIGEQIFKHKLIESGISITKKSPRKSINIGEIIFPYISFESEEFDDVKNWLSTKVIQETKGVFTGLNRKEIQHAIPSACLDGPKGTVKNLNCIVDGFRFNFGTGGIHGANEPDIYKSDENYIIYDIDVASLYPSIGIENDLFPEHLTHRFINIYKGVREERFKFDKGSLENAAYKLALNGVYGKSNDKYSIFYDPKYTMSITINGQLLICMLAERVMSVKSVKIIQVNTDGITMKVHRKYLQTVKDVSSEWSKLTGLVLEEAEFSMFCMRDVNNYIGVLTSGKIKRKGAYNYDTQWHQDFSALIIPKAVEKYLLNDIPLEETISGTGYDYFLMAKVPRNSKLLHGSKEIQRISRFVVSKKGDYLTKVMPPLKGKDSDRNLSLIKGFRTTIFNDTKEIPEGIINHDWYIEEARKLISPMTGVV